MRKKKKGQKVVKKIRCGTPQAKLTAKPMKDSGASQGIMGTERKTIRQTDYDESQSLHPGDGQVPFRHVVGRFSFGIVAGKTLR